MKKRKAEKDNSPRAPHGAEALQTICAVAVCKGSRAVLHRIGRGGTSLPGKAAMFLKKDLLAAVSRDVDSIVVTGTNGKTTTSAMLESALRQAGMDAVSNRSGANLLSGVTAEFASCADWRGRPSKHFAVIECDEGALHQVVPLLKPKVIVVTNLFRDQLDRYGEVMHTREAIRRGIEKVPEAVLCLNADDSLTASLALDLPNPVVWFGLEAAAGNTGEFKAADRQSGSGKTADKQTNVDNDADIQNSFGEDADTQSASGRDTKVQSGSRGDKDIQDIQSGAQISDARYCIRCGAQYKYGFRTYAHLGDFRCPSCGFSRPRPDVTVSSIESMDISGTQIRMRIGKTENIKVRVAAPAVYNLYNAAAAVCAGSRAGIRQKAIFKALARTSGSFGRMETFDFDGVRAQMILVKNPAGCNQALDYLTSVNQPFAAILCLNDEDADGHDISWIWDVDYEKLCENEFLQKTYVWGKRAEDLQLRLKYAGAAQSDIELVREKENLVKIIRTGGLPVFILPNYTSMLSLREVLKKETGKAEFWKGNA